jgi:hypothetical protein
VPHPLRRAAALATAALATLAVPAAGLASAAGKAPPAGAATLRTVQFAGGAQASAAAALVLINGDTVLAGSTRAAPDTQAVQRAPGSGLASALLNLRLDGKIFLIPVAALPYLGHGLDPSLFDVSALRQAEQGGRLPVRIGYRGTWHSLPGITVTRRAAGTARGYLTAASSALFGAALARQFTADHARGSYGSAGLFAGGVSVSLPDAAPAPVRPAFAMHVLTVKGTNLAGKPDNGDVVDVLNVDDLAKSGLFGSENFFFHGVAKFSEPAGTYWAVGTFFTGGFRVAVLPQFTIKGNTTVSVSEQAASSKITMITPRPSVSQGVSLTVVRRGQHALASFGWSFFGGGSIWVSPVSHRPSDGTLLSFTSGQLTSPRGASVPYAYTLDFASPPGTISPQHFVVRAADVATVSERYYQDLKSTGGWITLGGTRSQIQTSFIGGLIVRFRLPTRQVQYISARPAMLWQTFYAEFYASLGGGQTEAFRLLHGGQRLTGNWNRYPLHPTPNDSLPGTGIFAALPTAVRAGDTLLLDITPFGDNHKAHTGTGFFSGFFNRRGKVTGSYALFVNGTKVAGGSTSKVTHGASGLFLRTTLGTAPSTVKLAVSADRGGQQYMLSPASQDVWTWQSRPQPSAAVPAPWFCGFSRGHFDRHCAVQDMMMMRYHVAALGLDGAGAPGRQVVFAIARHLPVGPSPKVTSATVAVSFDHGKTWQRARVRRVLGSRFRAIFNAPPSHEVSLRVTARDAAGATLTETIRDAYRTSA